MGGRRRATRGVLSQDRIRARDDLMRVPSNVGDCIFHLRIVEDSQVYRDLILAIRQFTGYTKRFPNVRGQVPARDIGPDGSTRPEFSSAFMSVVDAFLVERKGGTVFFPLIVPHDANWHNGFIDMEEMPRLVWDNLEDEQDIRVNMARLFEALKLNGLPVSSCGKIFDLEKANLIKSFDTEDCFICGSPAADALVKCQKCRCHFHQQCYAIALMPEDRELWYCRRCTKITDEEESRKAEAREKSHEVEPEDDDPANDNDATNEKEPANDDEPINSFNKLHSPRASHAEASSLTSIFPSKRDNIIILARLNSKDAYRLIDITDVHSLEGLFEACGTAWHIQVKSFYIYLPLNTGVLEILADESASFQLAMKMFQPVPDNDKAVTIRVLVLAEGETYT